MPLIGDFPTPVSQGEIRSFSIDFSDKMVSPTEALTGTPTSTLHAVIGKDPNASGLLLDVPVINGTAVSQFIGAYPFGYQPGVTYEWQVGVDTTLGQHFVDSGRIICNPPS